VCLHTRLRLLRDTRTQRAQTAARAHSPSTIGLTSPAHFSRKRGFEVVDTDEPGWTDWCDEGGGYLWREERIAELLAEERRRTLYVSGTVANQGRFYPQFVAVVLLSAPADVLLGRIERRTTNQYGKAAAEREAILRHLAEAEPLLHATCTHEIDATQPIEGMVAELVAIGIGADA
jgi:hypothetical protein